MSQYFQHWKDLFDALSLRERAFISIASFAILIMGWDAGLMRQLYIKKDSSAEQIQLLTQQIKDVDQKIHDFIARLNSAGNAAGLRRIKELKTSLTELNEKQEKLAVQFIRPKQMVQVLKGMLVLEKGLKLTRLESALVEPLFKPLSNKAGIGIETADIDEVTSLYKQGKATNALTVPQAETLAAEKVKREMQLAKKLPQVFKHALEIEFQGSYQSTLNYLKNLEKLPWRFYWEGVNYEVVKYPKANITINIYTLSLDKGWIGV